MSKDGKDGSGGADGNSGGKDGKPPKKEDSVSFETHQKLMDEKKAQSSRLKELEDKFTKQEEDQKVKAQDDLKAQGKFKEALAARDDELAAEKLKGERLNSQIIDNRKLSAFVNAVPGGVESRYWSLVDLEKIKVDDVGRPTEDSVKDYSKSFQESFPELLKKPEENDIPPGNPKPPGSGKLSHEAWKLLPAKEMRERIADVDPSSVPKD